jgi:uncharacterized Tic20 family protein
MLFILFFSLGVLAVPLAIDIGKRGKDNILRRSGRDVLNYRLVRTALGSLNVATGRVSAFTAGVASLAMLAFLAYATIKGISFVTHAFTAVFGNG